jgi:hypothetical protein
VGRGGDTEAVDHPDRLAAISREETLVRRQIQREGLLGLMNAPKWRRLVDALDPFALRFRRKLVDENDPEAWGQWLDVPSPGYVDTMGGPV